MAQTTIDGVARNAVVIIAVIAAGAALFWLRGILTPLALAIFLAVMIDGFARILAEKTPRFPKAAALPTAIVLTILVLIALAIVIADNAAGFANQLITYAPKLEALISQVAGALGVEAPPSLAQLIREANPAQYATTIAQGLQGVLTDTFFVLIYLAFIIASRRGFRKKIVAMFPHSTERDEAMAAFVRCRISPFASGIVIEPARTLPSRSGACSPIAFASET